MNFGLIYPLENYVVICDRPTEVHRNESGLHRDGGAALSYGDDFKIYSLNGVRVPEWLATDSSQEIDPKKFTMLDNVEHRREFIRKIGIERISDGAEVIDSQGEMYELLLIDLIGDTGKCPYLKMKNPSISVWHLEGVPKGTKTVAAALLWRNQSEVKPEQLT